MASMEMHNFEYFRKPVVITGKHARLVDDMWEQNQIQKSYFRRLVDLYTIAPIIGLRTKRTAFSDSTEERKRTIQVEQLLEKEPELRQIMRMIILLDKTQKCTKEERVNKAFRGPKSQEEFEKDTELFNSYVRGGIEVLHELLVQRALGIEDEYNDVRVGNIMALINNPLIPDIE